MSRLYSVARCVVCADMSMLLRGRWVLAAVGKSEVGLYGVVGGMT